MLVIDAICLFLNKGISSRETRFRFSKLLKVNNNFFGKTPTKYSSLSVLLALTHQNTHFSCSLVSQYVFREFQFVCFFHSESDACISSKLKFIRLSLRGSCLSDSKVSVDIRNVNLGILDTSGYCQSV